MDKEKQKEELAQISTLLTAYCAKWFPDSTSATLHVEATTKGVEHELNVKMVQKNV